MANTPTGPNEQERYHRYSQPAYYSPATFKELYVYLSNLVAITHEVENEEVACTRFSEYYGDCSRLRRSCTNNEERNWYENEMVDCTKLEWIGYCGGNPIEQRWRHLDLRRVVDELCKRAVRKMRRYRPGYARWQPFDYSTILQKFERFDTRGWQELWE